MLKTATWSKLAKYSKLDSERVQVPALMPLYRHDAVDGEVTHLMVCIPSCHSAKGSLQVPETARCHLRHSLSIENLYDFARADSEI